MLDWDKLLARVADVALRDMIRRQVEIQNETIKNLESLVNSQRNAISQLDLELKKTKEPKYDRGGSEDTGRLFESNSVFWSVGEVRGLKVYKAHCPQCQSILNRIVDFWKCRSCGYNNLGARDKPSNIPDWAG